MITDNMSYSEIANEFKSDWSNYLSDRIPEIMETPKYRKFVLKNVKDEQECYFKPVDIKVNGNNYILQISTVGRSEFKKKGLRFRIYMYYTRKEGTYVIMRLSFSEIVKGGDTYCIYPPHLFERYRERVLGQTYLSEMETIFKFFENDNGTFNSFTKNLEKYPNSLFSVTTNGVMLGEKLNDNIIIAKTYVSFDMLKGNQIEDKQKLLDSVQEYIKNEM
jgi:hypothetical protein